MAQYKMWIGGKWVEADSGKTYPVYNPATEAEIAQVPLCGQADVDKVVAAARQAFPVWSNKPQAERSQIAMKIAALIQDNAKELGRIDTLDHGTPTIRAAAKAAASAAWFEWAA
jgi:acyl-CoA reductase-like NAD-dependent aldehyde dehydrogenase